ncbi:PREDICTED: fatty acid synthase-like [Dinoponera quadriceps]|uniref:Fatty acid synthase-like n=1 Tax=Dinoponera quadriceps TaxID=609295 RepID=A0A6P3XWV0_DINQU|nr:PREDICTED: fatty acid synthase-like [Dinoponera quadriceps]
MAKSLKSTVLLISLCEHSKKNTIQSFLKGIGDLYNIGFQPQIASLYPPVQFPVSRGTPMISPLVRWDHSEDYFFYRYSGYDKIFSRERIVTISIAIKEFEYLSGHITDGKNLLPVIVYLLLIWQMIGSNNFEIIEGDKSVDDIACEKLPVQFLSNSDEDNEYMNTEDIYKELRLRGYQYTGLFHLLKSASITGKSGHIRWPINYTAFMGNMLQMKILSFNSKNHYAFLSHYKSVDFVTDLPVHIYDCLDAIVSGGIEICGIKATAISRRLTKIQTIYEEYSFIPYRDNAMMSLKDVVRMSVHIALECYEMINIRVIEFIEDSDIVLLDDLFTPIVQEVLNNLPLVRSNLTNSLTQNNTPTHT